MADRPEPKMARWHTKAVACLVAPYLMSAIPGSLAADPFSLR